MTGLCFSVKATILCYKQNPSVWPDLPDSEKVAWEDVNLAGVDINTKFGKSKTQPFVYSLSLRSS